MPRHGGLVSEGHRHSLDRPVSPCYTSKGLIRPMSHNSLTEREVTMANARRRGSPRWARTGSVAKRECLLKAEKRDRPAYTGRGLGDPDPSVLEPGPAACR